MLAILSKELKSYFYSASAYIFMGVFLLLAGIFFSLTNVLVSSPNGSFNQVLSSLTFVFLLLVPVLTMKIIAEESRSRTDQLLYTSPISITKIVLGKYFAALTLFIVTLLVTALFPLMLSLFGQISVIEILTSYIGFFLMGCCMISIGLFISSLTDNQVVAAVGTFGALLLLWLIDSVSSSLPAGRTAGIIFILILVALLVTVVYFATKNIFVTACTGVVGIVAMAVVYFVNNSLYEGLIAKFFGWISVLQRSSLFSQGILDLSSILYFVSYSFVFVFLTIRMIEKRRWS
jgi:hypothetical protein